MNRSGTFGFWLFPLLAFGAADPMEAGMERFQAGYRAWDAAALREAADRFSSACVDRPDSYEAHYWLGAARFHLLLHRLGDEEHLPDKREKNRLLDEAVAPLERAVELNPKDSEAHALLGTLLGMRIAGDPKCALWLGPSVLEHRRSALRNGPDNPRAQYLTGSAYFHMPTVLGRKDKGLEFFLRAEELFKKEQAAPRAPLQPTWGYGSCLTFLGRIYAHTGRTDEAKACFQRALAVNPEDKLARQCLESLGGTERENAKR